LAHLIVYLEKNAIDISAWPLKNFRSAVDFYLNKAFNMSNMLTFTRYYVYHHTCKLNKAIDKVYGGKNVEDMSEKEKYGLCREVFNS